MIFLSLIKKKGLLVKKLTRDAFKLVDHPRSGADDDFEKQLEQAKTLSLGFNLSFFKDAAAVFQQAS